MRIIILLTLLLSLAQSARAIEVQRDDIVIDTLPAEFRARIGDSVTFSVRLLRDGQQVVGQRMGYELSWDTFEVIEKGNFTTGPEDFVITTTATREGFVRLWIFGEGLRDDRSRRNEAGVAVEPETIQPGQSMPEDFDTFWDNVRQRVFDTPMFPHLEPVDNGIPDFETFDLQINAPGGLNCSGYYGRPVGAESGSLPAILYVHASGVYSSWLAAANQGAEFNAIVYDLNNHGVPNGREEAYYTALFEGPLNRYWLRGIESREDCYYLGIYMRIIRALQFLKGQPEWDGKNLVVRGGSEGGGLAVAAAGLDPDVNLVVAEIPALCDQMGFVRGQPVGFPWVAFNGFPPQAPVNSYNEKAADTWRYFDAVNLAKKANASLIVTVGFIDTSVPPTSVYAMFNSFPTMDKLALDYPDLGHGFPTRIPNTRGRLNTLMLDFIRDGFLNADTSAHVDHE